jgi:hypothetical protein
MRNYGQNQLPPYVLDETILELRRAGLSYRKIGKVVHMSANGVMHRLHRLQAGGPGTR